MHLDVEFFIITFNVETNINILIIICIEMKMLFCTSNKALIFLKGISFVILRFSLQYPGDIQ